MLWSFIIGLIAGFVANAVIRGGGYGLIANLIVGLVGALSGTWIAQAISCDGLGPWGIVLSSTIGAVVLLILIAIVAKRTNNG